jgi:hypothetical protein
MNLFWAFAYNIAIMPIVAGVFYSLDVVVSATWSSIAMSASSLFVVGFSHLLSFFHFDDSLGKEEVKVEEESEAVLFTDRNETQNEIKRSMNKMGMED